MSWVITRDGLKSEDDLREELDGDDDGDDRFRYVTFQCFTCGGEWDGDLFNPTSCPHCDGA